MRSGEARCLRGNAAHRAEWLVGLSTKGDSVAQQAPLYH
jgi:hypothetical protein